MLSLAVLGTPQQIRERLKYPSLTDRPGTPMSSRKPSVSKRSWMSPV
jgi:hypothetical protein